MRSPVAVVCICIVAALFSKPAASATAFDTTETLDYQYRAVKSSQLRFQVRTSTDAHIALRSGSGKNDSMVEIFLGGWGNTRSNVRNEQKKPDVVSLATPRILNAKEFRGFWIRWTGWVLLVGKAGENKPFITWTNPKPFPVNTVGFRTAYGSGGSWIVEDEAEEASVSAQIKIGAGGPFCSGRKVIVSTQINI